MSSDIVGVNSFIVLMMAQQGTIRGLKHFSEGYIVLMALKRYKIEGPLYIIKLVLLSKLVATKLHTHNIPNLHTNPLLKP